MGDDRWLKPDDKGMLRAINPEAGFFGVALELLGKPIQMQWSPCGKTVFSLMWLLLKMGIIWWEGLTDDPPKKLTDWKGREWSPESEEPTAHPNARFTCPASQCPTIDPDWENPDGVPISAFIFGGRGCLISLWSINPLTGITVFISATLASETIAAAEGALGI